MTGLEVLSCGPGACVQDGGRVGYRRYGVSTSGAMDRHALAVANALVGNPPGTAAVELPLSGARFVCRGGPLSVAVWGAVLDIAGIRGAPLVSAVVKPDQPLRVGPTLDGVYAYLAVAGGIRTPPDLGSRSWHRRSGLGGPPLTSGALLPCEVSALPPLCYAGPPRADPGAIRFLPGPQAHMFAPEVLDTLSTATFRVDPRSDRMGLRLAGPALPARDGHDIVSDGVVPGSIQVPGDGQPLVLMRDCQTTGGYPKIATVISADLDWLAQLRVGQAFRFREVTLEAAQAAARTAARTVAEIGRHLRPVGAVSDTLLSQNLIGGVTAGDDL